MNIPFFVCVSIIVFELFIIYHVQFACVMSYVSLLMRYPNICLIHLLSWKKIMKKIITNIKEYNHSFTEQL